MSVNADLDFEQALARLQEIVQVLESGNVSLAQGLALYKEGAACSRQCRGLLNKARHEISLWQDGCDCPWPEKDFEDSGRLAAEAGNER